MMHLIHYTFISFASLFVIIDPVGLIPVFLSMTHNHSVQERIRTARMASVATFVILTSSSLFGQWIFRIFSITLPAFEIAGGIILLLVALDMLQARRTAVKETKEEQVEGAEKEDLGITPLAIPMLAGPGAITTVILLTSQAESLQDQLALFGNLLLIAVITFLILRWVAIRSASLSVIAIKITTRLMGLLLSAIAVQFILNGIQTAKIFSGPPVS